MTADHKCVHVGIIGAGIAGLVAAYELSRAGVRVTLVDRAGRLGGLASSLPLGDGREIERYYHFICGPDQTYFDMLQRLGIADRLRWRVTDMGLFYQGAVHTLGDPVSVLAFSHLSLVDKIRFGWTTMAAKLAPSSGWRQLENVPVREWLISGYGRRTYNLLYAPLLAQKFHDDAEAISAAWMWARFHRLANSRTATLRERLGYLDGGTQVYVSALEKELRAAQVDIRLDAPVSQIVIDGGRARAIRCGDEMIACDQVLSTAPIPVTRALCGELPGPYFDNLRSLRYIGVLVMLLRLKRSFSKYFWMNVSDPAIALAGIIEYTNLNPCPELGGQALLYMPQYLPTDHPVYRTPDDELFRLYCGYLARINPAFDESWVEQYWVHRDANAQPICEVGFSQHIPAMQTPIDNLYLTDSYQLHPDDRTVSNSSLLGQRAAALILSKHS